MTPYARRGVHGQIVEALARRILGGRIPEGATLDLVALQGELGVSLTALRESLKVLAAKGMVDARQKRGTFVRARADWNLLDADVLRWRFEGADRVTGADRTLLHDLAEVRAVVEPAAARLAAERRTDADLAALETALEAMDTRGSDPARAVEADLAFHRALLRATRNELLDRMEMVIEPGLAHRDRIVHSHPHSGDPVPAHRAVLDAVRHQDPRAAEAAMRALLVQAGRDLDRIDAPDDVVKIREGAPFVDLPAALATHRLVAIVRGDDPDAALRTVLALADEGVELIEVSLTGTAALSVIERARDALGPDHPLGAGTVLTAEDARAAHGAGADFAVTPGLGDGVRAAQDLGMPVLAGVLTPTEIIAARALGVAALKIFPIAQAGGAAYLKALRGPFPEAPLVPVGGIDEAAARACLAAGALAVGVGSPLIGDAADGGSITALRKRARLFRTVVAEAPR